MKRRTMKRVLSAAVALCLCLLLMSGCSASRRLGIPKGYTAKEEHFDRSASQDRTDWCRYSYKDAGPFGKDERYRKISGAETGDVRGYFEDFLSWMEIEGRSEEFDFDPGCVTEGDRVYIRAREGQGPNGKYQDYSVCFFDADACVLTYIRHNI